jgi:hypothetical protein
MVPQTTQVRATVGQSRVVAAESDSAAAQGYPISATPRRRPYPDPRSQQAGPTWTCTFLGRFAGVASAL